MSVATLISRRRQLIFQRINKRDFPTIEQIIDYVQKSWDEDVDINKSTTEKDIAALKSDPQYSTILYDKKRKGYYIDDESNKRPTLDRLMNAMDLFETLRNEKDSGNFIQLEQQSSQNLELLPLLINAIKQQKTISFSHFKFWEGTVSERKVNPYGLKEFKQRWYLIAEDTVKREFKSFSIDRISDLRVMNNLFQKDKKFSLTDFFKYSYGIYNSTDNPIEAILSFIPEQGNYIKSLPLHPSQKILVDNQDELRVSITVWDSFEFIQQLVSYSDHLKVLAPESLISKVKNWFSEGLIQYSDH